jgi:hypothetical protein
VAMKSIIIGILGALANIHSLVKEWELEERVRKSHIRKHGWVSKSRCVLLEFHALLSTATLLLLDGEMMSIMLLREYSVSNLTV